MTANNFGHKIKPRRPEVATHEHLGDRSEPAGRNPKGQPPADTRLKYLAEEFLKQMQRVAWYSKQPIHEITEVLSDQLKVVRTPEEFQELQSACSLGKYKEVHRWLDRRIRELKRYWKYVLQVPRHRTAKPEVASLYQRAAYMKVSTKLSWSQIARDLDPESFKANPTRTTARLKQGSLKELRRTLYW